ncbi:MAG: GyrI-like domain-containing protein [Candidatus Merdivicinus sp.]|jgi:predicted transcriptional regulator YdeE
MAELIQFQMMELPAFRMMGKALTVSPYGANPIPEFWRKCFADGTFPVLEAMKDAQYQEILDDARDAYIGWMGDLREDGSFTCLIGMLMRPGTPAPEGFAFRDVPACRAAAGRIKGNEPEIYAMENDLLLPEMEKLGLAPDSFCMEVYACPRFTTPDPADGTVILDYYMQVR